MQLQKAAASLQAQLKESEKRVEKRVEQFAGAGNVLTDIWKKNQQIRTITKEAAEAEKKAAEAMKEAAEADKKVTEAKKAAEEAKQEAADAQKEAARAKKEAAMAKIEAANAKKEAADANKEASETNEQLVGSILLARKRKNAMLTTTEVNAGMLMGHKKPKHCSTHTLNTDPVERPNAYVFLRTGSGKAHTN